MLNVSELTDLLDKNFKGHAQEALENFYNKLPSVPGEQRPAVLIGMGYNFEYYDALFSLMLSNALFSMSDGDYTPRYRAAQFLLRPFSSEYGIEAGRKLARTHRELYADFYRIVIGEDMDEQYPAGNGNEWLNVSRRWSEAMRESLSRDDQGAWHRAAYNIGYHWAVERLSLFEFLAMRKAWNKMGFEADYLNAHCSVEEEHGDWAEQAVAAFTDPEHPAIKDGIRMHEDHLAGYYNELSSLI